MLVTLVSHFRVPEELTEPSSIVVLRRGKTEVLLLDLQLSMKTSGVLPITSMMENVLTVVLDRKMDYCKMEPEGVSLRSKIAESTSRR